MDELIIKSKFTMNIYYKTFIILSFLALVGCGEMSKHEELEIELSRSIQEKASMQKELESMQAKLSLLKSTPITSSYTVTNLSLIHI